MKMLIKKLHRYKYAGVVAMAAILLTSCGGGAEKHEEKPVPPQSTAPYTAQQQIFSMCMLSNISAHYNGKTDSPGSIQDSTINAVTQVLADAGIQGIIGKWNLVWGPCVETNPDGRTARNTMFVAQKAGTDSFVVAIAGTDPSSAYDWFVEDFDIMPILWNIKYPLAGFVSGATYTGLDRLKKMTSKDSTAGQALAARIKSLGGGQIFVTGHSLGGALSPAYALYLEENMQTWSGKTPTINCLAVAGATPGDKMFSDYYNKKLGNTTTRVWNTRDVIPHGYASYMLQELPTLYPADSVSPMPQPLVTLIGKIDSVAKVVNYTQLYPPATDSFTSLIYTNDSMKNKGALMPADTAYLGQLIFQHIPSYGVRFGTFTFQQGVQRVLSLSDPFFTQSAILVPVVNNGQLINP